MKLNRTFVFATLVAGSLFATGIVAHAQDSTATNAPAATKKGHNNFAAIAKQLDLTDDQKPKVQAIISDMQQKMKDLRGDTTLSADDRKSKMKEIRTDASSQLKDILTPDQFAKYQKMTMGRRRPAPDASTTTNAPAN